MVKKRKISPRQLKAIRRVYAQKSLKKKIKLIPIKKIVRPRYIYAYDPKIKRRVVHVLSGAHAISLITKNKFKYKPKKVIKRKKKYGN